MMRSLLGLSLVVCNACCSAAPYPPEPPSEPGDTTAIAAPTANTIATDPGTAGCPAVLDCEPPAHDARCHDEDFLARCPDTHVGL